MMQLSLNVPVLTESDTLEIIGTLKLELLYAHLINILSDSSPRILIKSSIL